MTEANLRVRVLLVEDHPVTRLGIATALQADPSIDVVGEAATVAEASRILATTSIDVLLVDLRLPDGDALDLLRLMRERSLSGRVLIVTGSDAEEPARRALQLGAHGYLTKDEQAPELIRAVHEVARGKRVLAEPVAAALRAQADRPMLTARELDVLRLMSEGRTNPEIGYALGLSTGTVRTHVSHILEKLEVSDRTEAATAAFRRGLL